MNLKELRKRLYDHAEKSGCEHRTKHILREVLSKHRCALFEGQDGCSLYAYYDFKKEKTVMIRAEMDGIAVENQIRHACGHDGHMSMLCGLSERLSELNTFNVNVLLVFQSSEETGAGALNILTDPVFLKLCPDEAIGLHCFPMSEKGFYARSGVMCASGKEVRCTFSGESGHCALQLKKTALRKAVDFLHELHQKEFDGGFISMNVIRCGSSCNQTAEKVDIEGTIRALSGCSERGMMDWLKKYDGSFQFSSGYPVLRNHSSLVKRAVECGAQILDSPLWICDDFACYAQCLPSVYVLMGMNSEVPLHHVQFEFDDELLESGVDFLMKMLLKS